MDNTNNTLRSLSVFDSGDLDFLDLGDGGGDILCSVIYTREKNSLDDEQYK